MISKKVPMKSAFKSSFKRLAEYITDTQGKEQRVEGYTITNCENPDSLAWAIREIESTQAQNTRAKGDKTYHFLISFAPGEQVSRRVMQEIEQRMCDALGYGEHQRISAIHSDTDNLHIHIAVNKIHPVTHRMHEPYQDFKTRSALCRQLEDEYGLVKTNHTAKKVLSESKAKDMERFAGVESLIGWIQREHLPDLMAAQSWSALHDALAKNGLTLKERGAGFVIQAEDGTTVKASSISRDLSKPRLERRLGAFQQGEERGKGRGVRKEGSYRARPLKTKFDTTALYARYRAEMSARATRRKEEGARITAEKAAKIEAARRKAALQRAAVKMTARGLTKKTAYALVSKQLRDTIARINEDTKSQRAGLYEKSMRMAWNDWLRDQAVKGNNDALQVLRERRPEQRIPGLRASGPGAAKQERTNGSVDSITRQGTIIYKGPAAIRDTGKQIQVVQRTSDENLRMALEMAAARFGKSIHVDGDLLFKQKIVAAAARSGIDIVFDDAAMERHRQHLVNQQREYESRTNRIAGTGDRVAGVGRSTAAEQRTGLSQHGAGRHSAVYQQPNPSRVGTEPPPFRRGRLHDLSKLGLVRIGQRDEVLLPSHVSGVMEQQRAERDSNVRRNEHSVTLDKSSAQSREAAAVAAYVNERELRRQSIFDISKHLPYNGQIVGSVQFGGIRRINGVSLALLQKDASIYVKAVSEKEAGRLRSVAKNSTIRIDEYGSITVGGRRSHGEARTKQRGSR